MNNNRNNNNRRRGRGNRNQGGGNQGNRIDSRARGNAPQMLEKYKKLAQDAQHNGDRVQAEYYLQFADHYFRVLADNRTRQDENRPPRQREDRDFDDGNDDGDFEDRQRSQGNSRRNRDRDENREEGDRDDRGRDDAGREDGRRESSGRRDSRSRDNRRSRDDSGSDDEAKNEFEPAENPFTRKSEDEAGSARRGALKPRRSRAAADVPSEIDAAVLPPSLGARETANDASDEEAAPKPRRRRRKADEDGAVSAVG